MSTEPFLATRLSVFTANDHPQVQKQNSLGEIKAKKKQEQSEMRALAVTFDLKSKISDLRFISDLRLFSDLKFISDLKSPI